MLHRSTVRWELLHSNFALPCGAGPCRSLLLLLTPLLPCATTQLPLHAPLLVASDVGQPIVLCCRRYKYFIFLNSSIKGPFVPNYMPPGWQWTQVRGLGRLVFGQASRLHGTCC